MFKALVLVSIVCLLTTGISSRSLKNNVLGNKHDNSRENVVDMFGSKKKHKKDSGKSDDNAYLEDEDDYEEDKDEVNVSNANEVESHRAVQDDSGDEMTDILEDAASFPKDDNNDDRSEDDMFVKNRRELKAAYLSKMNEDRKRRASDEDGDVEYREKPVEHDYVDTEDKDYGDDLLPDRRYRREDMDSEYDHIDNISDGSTQHQLQTTSEIYIPVSRAENELNDLIQRSKNGVKFDPNRIPIENRYFGNKAKRSHVVEDYDYQEIVKEPNDEVSKSSKLNNNELSKGRFYDDDMIYDNTHVTILIPLKKPSKVRQEGVISNRLKKNTKTTKVNNKITTKIPNTILSPTTTPAIKKRQVRKQ